MARFDIDVAALSETGLAEGENVRDIEYAYTIKKASNASTGVGGFDVKTKLVEQHNLTAIPISDCLMIPTPDPTQT